MTESNPAKLKEYRTYAYRLFLEKLYRTIKQHRKNNTVNVGEIEDTVRHLRQLQEALEGTETVEDDTTSVKGGQEIVVVSGCESYVRYYE